jgi:hypothetical protein
MVMRVATFTTRPLYRRGKRPWYPLDRRLGRPQSRSGRGGEYKENPLPVSAGNQTLVVQPRIPFYVSNKCCHSYFRKLILEAIKYTVKFILFKSFLCLQKYNFVYEKPDL